MAQTRTHTSTSTLGAQRRRRRRRRRRRVRFVIYAVRFARGATDQAQLFGACNSEKETASSSSSPQWKRFELESDVHMHWKSVLM